MAKKNKKFTKINQKIKKFFDNDPFDVGIERVSSDTLSELMHYLGIYDIEYSKSVMIKTVRNLWSTADIVVREMILEFFAQNGKIYKSDKSKEPIAEKMEKINAFLDELEVTPEEAVTLYEAFRDVRSKKITLSKMRNKLELIRFESKRLQIEDACDGTFDLHDRFEFHAPLQYRIFGEEFNKIEVLHTKPYELSWLKETPLEEIVNKIETDKKEAAVQRQKQLDAFLASITLPHKYLQKSQILHALKAVSPTSELNYPALKARDIKAILAQYREIKEVKVERGELFFVVEESITLPVTHQKVSYDLEVYYPLDELLERIWLAEPLELEGTIDNAKKEHEGSFLSELELIIQESDAYAKSAGLSLEEFYRHIYEVLLPYVGRKLVISPKLVKKTSKRFLYAIQEHMQRRQRQQLLAQSIRDFKNLFPIARSLRRKLTLHIGPTNSGKTYTAMERLKKADTGYYLAPLRLLALEGYENLKAAGIEASLITGEEQLLDPDATHISSTIEMLNYDVDVDVCVIDEVQLIDDRDRGWAWANAIIGAPAKEIVMTGSPASKDAIIELAKYLGEELEIVEFERKNPLTLLKHHTPLEKIEKGTAVIAFSRKEVLKLKQKLSSHFSVSTVYGNLSPEVRREEARRFREGETEVLVATDAISMGMNLPIKTILFTKAQKFDGIMDRELFPNEIKQIAGRAGRYGIEEEGFVGATSPEVLKVIRKNWEKPDIPVALPFKVMANLDHIKLVSSILEENSLAEVLRFFAKNMVFSGPFEAADLEDMVEIATVIDNYELDTITKFHLATAPLTLNSPYILGVFESYLESLENKKPIRYNPPRLGSDYALTNEDLLHAEDMVKEISLYLWLSYRFEEYFVDADKAREHRAVLNAFIERSLQQKQFAFRCKLCNTVLPVGSKFRICERCYKKTYKRGHRKRH